MIYRKRGNDGSAVWRAAGASVHRGAVLLGAVLIILGLVAIPGESLAAEHKLSFPVAGVVAKVMVQAGQQVKAGDVLAQLDLVPFNAMKRAADADLQAAGQTLTFMTQNRNRAKQLFDDLSTSAEELERAELDLLQAVAGKVRAQAQAEIAAWNLNRATLRAPTGGTVNSVPGYAGMVVDPSSEIVPVVVLSSP